LTFHNSLVCVPSGIGMSKPPLISIIDDDALARDGIRELVESLGYRATTFASAQHFLGSNTLAETTCLITDVQTPGLSGVELQEVLRSRGYRTPVILITAYPNEKQRSRALDAGAVGFLSKPFDEESLIKCLTAAITASAQAVKRFITLSSTTSMQDSGLLGHVSMVRICFSPGPSERDRRRVDQIANAASRRRGPSRKKAVHNFMLSRA